MAQCFVDPMHPNYVCLLKKSLYGLKWSPRQWYKKFDMFVMEIDVNNIPIYLLLYVDVMLIISKLSLRFKS